MRVFRVPSSVVFNSSLKRFNSSNINNIQKELNAMKKKLQYLEEMNSSDGLIRLYASRKIKNIGIQKAVHIFSSSTFHAPIYCHEHLPIVLAHTIRALDTLPAGLNSMPSTLRVRGVLLSSFLKLIECPIPITTETENKFKDVLVEVEDAHAETDLVQTMAVGILELRERVCRHRKALVDLKKSSPKWSKIRLSEKDILPYEELEDIQEPLDFINRCLIRYNFLSRMLLNMENMDLTGNRVGMVDLEINLENVVRNAVDEAKQICNDHYGDCPDVNFIFSGDSRKMTFPFMSTTIRYIVVELLKNAFRATVESHMKRNDVGIVTCDDMPPVTVLVHLKEGIKHACIKISDEGNGMRPEDLQRAMSYSFTSVSDPALQLDSNGGTVQTDNASPLAGYGYGLPMSRVYAMSFGGDLTLQTMEGFGTSAYYYISLG